MITRRDHSPSRQPGSGRYLKSWTPHPRPSGSAPTRDARRLKWEAKQLDGTRPLGAWELYRALNDALDEGHDQFDLSNRDARLAMILMGGLNAALVILASQTSLRRRPLDARAADRRRRHCRLRALRDRVPAAGDRCAAAESLPAPHGRMARRSRRTIPAASATSRTSCCATPRRTGRRGGTSRSSS